MMLRITLTLIFSGAFLIASAQKVRMNCTEKLTESERLKVSDAFKKWKNRSGRRQTVQYTIPVVFHLIGSASASSDQSINGLIVELNDAFAHGGRFSSGPAGVDTGIEFCLAETSPDGGLTTGINRVPSDYGQFDMDLEDEKLKTITQWDPRFYMNVWVVNTINSEIISEYSGRNWWTRIPAGGYATLPAGVTQEGNFLDGIVVSALDAGLLAHECGHYLGLLHTFDGGCKNDDCQLDGDMVCDTPPDNSIFESCGDNSCTTDTLSNFSNNIFFDDVPDMGSNFMDYGNGSCSSDFSQGQAERMHFHLEKFRNLLFTQSTSTITPCQKPCESNMEVNIQQSILKPIPSDTVVFTADASGVDNYEWYVELLGDTSPDYSIVLGAGYTPRTSTISNSSSLHYTFEKEGKYRVYLKAWSSTNAACFTSDQTIVRVRCGVDARYWPDKRFIASKLPEERFIEPVNFFNRSTGADSYLWTVTHTDNIPNRPDLPVFNSTDEVLTHVFEEPGIYSITLEASSGACKDVANTFMLGVDDPTIDGIPELREVKCYNQDSLLVELMMFNAGYDTINIGAPITFYDRNPLTENSARIIGRHELDDVVYGFDSAKFSFIVGSVPDSSNLYAAFNDDNTTPLPLSFPRADFNVLSTDTEYPPSGYAELNYQNNTDWIESKAFDLSLDDIYACEQEFLSLQVENGIEVEWTSAHKGLLGDANPISYVLERNDTISVTWLTEFGCDFNDEFEIIISEPMAKIDTNYHLINKGSSVQLFASGGEVYDWIPTLGLNNSQIPTPVATPEFAITYIVQVADSIGCTDTDTVRIELITHAFIPDLFTPNGDNRNDVLFIYGLEDVEDMGFTIYNRVGSTVYMNDKPADLYTEGWDGTWRGQEQPSGTYFWKVSGRYSNGLPVLLNGEESGVIHLVR
ncbi:MAG: M43 family zinc metalloprotease [Bacteroidota bacterium]